jgi:hypothetical protein
MCTRGWYKRFLAAHLCDQKDEFVAECAHKKYVGIQFSNHRKEIIHESRLLHAIDHTLHVVYAH